MESLIDQILFLQKVSIFKDLTVEELGHIAAIGEILEYDEGEYLFREGEIGYNAYIVISGSVEIFRIFKKKKIVVDIMHRGNYFGEMAIFDGDVRSASAKTIEKSLIMLYKKEDMDRVILKYPSISLGIIKVMSKRLRDNARRFQKYEQIFSEFREFSAKIESMFEDKYFPHNRL